MLKPDTPPNLVIDFFAELNLPNAPPIVTIDKTKAYCVLFDTSNPDSYFDFLECYSGLWISLEPNGPNWDLIYPLNEWTDFSIRFSLVGDPATGFVILFIGGRLEQGRPLLEISYQRKPFSNEYVWNYRDMGKGLDLAYLDRWLRKVNESKQLGSRLPEFSIRYPEDKG